MIALKRRNWKVDIVRDVMRILNNERIFMKTSKPKLMYSTLLTVEVPSHPLFEKLQDYLAPYFIDGTDNMCTWETFSILAYGCASKEDVDLSLSEPGKIQGQEERDFIASVYKMAEGEIGDVVFYCSK